MLELSGDVPFSVVSESKKLSIKKKEKKDRQIGD